MQLPCNTHTSGKYRSMLDNLCHDTIEFYSGVLLIDDYIRFCFFNVESINLYILIYI